MPHTPHRKYRQSRELYDLIGRMAADLGTTRTTVVELAVLELARGLEARRVSRSRLAERAAAIDRVNAVAGVTAGTEALRQMGWIKSKEDE